MGIAREREVISSSLLFLLTIRTHLATVVEGGQIACVHLGIVGAAIGVIVVGLTAVDMRQQLGFTQARVLVRVRGAPAAIYPQALLAIDVQSSYLIGADHCKGGKSRNRISKLPDLDKSLHLPLRCPSSLVI